MTASVGKGPCPVISAQQRDLVPMVVDVSAKLNAFLIETISTLQNPV